MARESRRWPAPRFFLRKNAPATSTIPPSGTTLFILPNELLLIIASNLGLKDLSHLLLVSRRSANLLTSYLYDAAFGDKLQSYHAVSVICRAAKMGHEAIVKLLLDRGVSMIDPTPWVGIENPLHLAAREGHAGVVRLMMEHEAADKAVCLVDGHGNTPFHLAALNGQKAVMQILLESGIDPNLPGDIGMAQHGATALHYAAAWGHERVVRLLLRQGAKADATTKDWAENTPLQWVLENFCSMVTWNPLNLEPIIIALLENGADINRPDKHGRTVLHFASASGDYSPQRRFGEHHSQIRFRSANVILPKDPKQKRGVAKALHKPIIALLLKNGADINARDKDGKTPLYYAAEHGEEYCVRNFVELGADVNAQTSIGDTTLKMVVTKYWLCHSILMAQALLENGADLNIKDTNGLSALDVAMGGEMVPKERKQLMRLVQQFIAEMKPKSNARGFVSRLLHTRGSWSASPGVTRRYTSPSGSGIVTEVDEVSDSSMPNKDIVADSTVVIEGHVAIEDPATVVATNTVIVTATQNTDQ